MTRAPKVGIVLCMAALLIAGMSAFAVPGPLPAGDITTIAGGGVGDGGPAIASTLLFPTGVAVDTAGDVFIADSDGHAVREVTPNGVISTVAGNGTAGFLGDGGPATKASIQFPSAVAVDAAGNLYIATTPDNRIRRVGTNGIISTIAGNGTNVDAPDGSLATASGMVAPGALAFDTAGNLLVGEAFLVRRINAQGAITTIAGGGNPPDGLGDNGPATSAALSGVTGIAEDARGNLYISDQNNQRIRKVSAGVITTIAGDGNYGFSGDGGPAVNAEIGNPSGLAIDSSGNLFFGDNSNDIREIDAARNIHTFAGNGTFANSGDGGPATSAGVLNPTAVAAGGGAVYFTEAGGAIVNSQLRKVQGGIITRVAGGGVGDGDPGTSAFLNGPVGVRFAGGSLYISDQFDNLVRLLNSSGVISTVAGGGTPNGLGDGGPATSARLNEPKGIAVAPSGAFYIADCGDNVVRFVDPSGTISTVAGGGSPADGVGDGGPATSAQLSCPTGLLLAPPGSPYPAGTLFITDCASLNGGGVTSSRIREVDTSGNISTFAGTGTAGFNGDGLVPTATQFNCPSDLAMDPAGNVLVADARNNRVRKIDQSSGVVSTVAGNGQTGFGGDGVSATSVPVNGPTGLALDGVGDLLIAESKHARVRKVDPAGTISTIAGTGVPNFSGDGGPATLATLNGPAQVAVDSAGDVVFSDANNNRVREIASGVPATPPPGRCGEVITTSTTLHANIGPCPAGTDGIILGADNVTLNLNGHSVIGPGVGADTGGSVGIRIAQHTGDTITSGTVSGFDAGIALIGASNNAISHMTVQNNVAPLSTPNGFEGSEFGDGIVLLFSGGNKIDSNAVLANGPFDNIGLLGLGTNNNTISNNTIRNSAGDGMQRNPGIGFGIDLSPFVDITLPGRGGSLHGNNIVNNEVRGNYTSGISSQSNVGATIANNIVVGNGLKNPFPGNGIGVQHNARATPNLMDTIQSNTIHGNGGSGIALIGDQNRITDNVSTGNALLAPNSFDMEEKDFDPTTFQPSCLSNVWANNRWGAAGVNPPCVAGTGGVHPAAPATASATSDPTSPRQLSPADRGIGMTLHATG
jgi:hypothetical protein